MAGNNANAHHLPTANAIREARRAWIYRLASAETTAVAASLAADLIEDPPDCLEGMDVHELLESCFGVRQAHADSWQTAAGLYAATRIGELTYGKRCALVAVIRARFERPRPDRRRTRRRAA